MALLKAPKGVRLEYFEKEKKLSGYAKWGDKFPMVPELAGRLPNWPRWARLLTTLVIVGIITLIIWVVV